MKQALGQLQSSSFLRKVWQNHIIAWLLLLIMAILMVTSVRNDSTTTDERAHIPASVSYVKTLDYRLNPEHPPLLKIISGLAVSLFAKPNFSTNTPAWANESNGQWGFGDFFLYRSNNDVASILWVARLPYILLTLGFGAFFYLYIYRRFNQLAATLALFFYTFSPDRKSVV